MNSLLLAFIMFAAYIAAYHTYGKYISKKIFNINPQAAVPSEVLKDYIDFVPTHKHVLFGHHYTSIAGLGPIVGPALGIIWGWVPAVLWVLLGSIFMGAVHDFGALVISMRNEGRSIGDIASDVVNPRARTLFLLIIFFGLWIVIAVFSMIIALLFTMYPQAILPVWLEVPIALALGYLIYKKGMSHSLLGVIAVILMYITVIAGAYLPQGILDAFNSITLTGWIILLMVYAYIASTVPVQALMQPRDYINSHQLMIAMGLLCLGVIVAHPRIVAPAIASSVEGAPSLWPFLFITIACGAVSGFHSLVSSGTSSKQCACESHAQFVGYGGMLLEGALAALVIIAIAGGLGMGITTGDGLTLKGIDAFSYHYKSWAAVAGLKAKLDAFVMGSSNMMETLGIPLKITVTIMGVFIVSFAATTLDTATRIQRYVVSELGKAWKVPGVSGKHPATAIAVLTAMGLAFYDGSGKGALALWPLFGATNQLLAGLTLFVITMYLARRRKNIFITMIPMLFMLGVTGWAMVIQLNGFRGRLTEGSNGLLFGIGAAVLILEIWMLTECVIVLKKVYSSPPENDEQIENETVKEPVTSDEGNNG